MVIGITGKIGSGKSTVGTYFKKLGAKVIDADKVVHTLYEKDQEGARKIEAYFGEKFLLKDGSVNRKKLRKFIFNDLTKIKILNKMIHPLVFRVIEKMVKKFKLNQLVILEASYLNKFIVKKIIDKSILVSCLPSISLKRVQELGFNIKEIKFANEAQLIPEKIDFIVTNNELKKDLWGDLKDLNLTL